MSAALRGFALCALCALLAACTGSVSIPRPITPPWQTETPMQADGFVDSIGINTHLPEDLDRYGTGAVITARMKELGIRHIRDAIFALNEREYEDERRFLASTGSKMEAITDCPKPLGYSPGSQTPPRLIHGFDKNIGNAIELMEAPNEPDLRGVPDWPSLLISCIRKLGFNHALSVPFVAPAMGYGYHAERLGNISTLVDIGAIHSYFDGQFNPGFAGVPLQHNACGHFWSLPWEKCEARINSGNKEPLYVTETGFTAPASMDETSASKYISRVLFVDSIEGIGRTYLYELQDDGTDASNPEDGFGLVHHDGSPKPAFFAVRSVIRELADPGPSFTTAPLEYELRAGDNLRHELFQKRDGRYVLVLWEEVESWNVARHRENHVTPGPVTIGLPLRFDDVSAVRIDHRGVSVGQRVTLAGNEVTLWADDSLTFLTFRTRSAALRSASAEDVNEALSQRLQRV